MRPRETDRNLVEQGVLSDGMFGLSEQSEDQAHILSILRDRLYSNKILAILREYSTNAWDAHVEAGKPDVPIHIRLPTALDASFVVRDFGKGLSEEDVYSVYTKYGRSTKRNTDSQIGMLGIGCKSAFAYASTFTVTSHHGGKKMVFVAALDATNMGKMTKQYEGPTEETGIEVRVPVDSGDAYKFAAEAKTFFAFFRPRPVINIQLTDIDAMETEHGFLLKRQIPGWSQWSARMGCVPYRIDARQFSSADLQRYSASQSGCLYFNLGEVDVSANREELEYTPRTLAALNQKVQLLMAAQIDEVERQVAEASGIEKRQVARRAVSQIGIPRHRLSDQTAKLASDVATIYTAQKLADGTVTRSVKTFTLHMLPGPKIQQESQAISLDRFVTLCVLDSTHGRGGSLSLRKMRNYANFYGQNYYYALPKAPYKSEDVRRELEEILAAEHLTGLPVLGVEDLAVNLVQAKKRASNDKYRHKVFEFRENNALGRRKSNAWEPTDHKLDESSVFVRLEAFQPIGVTQDQLICNRRFLGELLPNEPAPVIYGVKTSETVRVFDRDVPGIPYQTWFEAKIKGALQTQPDLIEKLLQARDESDFRSYYNRFDSRVAPILEQALGDKHGLVQLIKRVAVRKSPYNGQAEALLSFIRNHYVNLGPEYDFLKRHAIDQLAESYPLLSLIKERNCITPENAPAWAQYILLMDRSGEDVPLHDHE